MAIYARRYFWADMDPVDNTELLDAFVAQPEFLTYPYPPEVARQVGAHILTDPANIIWASYSDKTLTGIILLQRVIPHVDALMHFLFLDRSLASKRNLLKNLIGVCFSEFGFNRLSMEFPDGLDHVRFARRVLGFKYEGEGRRHDAIPKSLTDDWIAKQGSRMESAHFNGTKWKDIVKLRLLASEWVENGDKGGQCRFQSSPQPQHPSSEDSLAKP